MWGRAQLSLVTDTPFLDTTILMAWALGSSREEVLATFPESISGESEGRFVCAIETRRTGTPVAYITGTKEFYGRPFRVDPRVLIPRPETEILVDVVLAAATRLKSEGTPPPLKIVEVGTGSGCVAITLILELSELEILAVEVSPEATEVFWENYNGHCRGRDGIAERLGIRRGSLLGEVAEGYSMIVSNPPYLTAQEMGGAELQSRREPQVALDGGADGLMVVRPLIEQSCLKLQLGGYLIMEAAPFQMDLISELMRTAGFTDIACYPDLSGRMRIIEGRFHGEQDPSV